MADGALFRACVATLSTGKAPGPDDVTNEVIKLLPEDVHSAIHNLFIIMWSTGITPSGWKPSNTVLPYKKKGSPLDIKNYRPISERDTRPPSRGALR